MTAESKAALMRIQRKAKAMRDNAKRHGDEALAMHMEEFISLAKLAEREGKHDPEGHYS